MSLFIFACIAGLLFGLYFAFVGLGITLVFGVLRLINLAQGDIIVLGAYIWYVLYTTYHMSIVGAGLLIIVGFLLIGYVLYWLVVPRLQRSIEPEMLSFVLFFGVSQIIEAGDIVGFGTNQYSMAASSLADGVLHFGSLAYSKTWLIIAGVSGLALGATYVFLYHTRYGHATRALIVNREETEATGIDVRMLSICVFMASVAMAGLAGVFTPYMLGAFSPGLGLSLTLIAFVIVILGSLGNPLGTIVGGCIYGVIIMLMETYIPSWTLIVPNLILLGVLLWKPEGLFGERLRRA